MFILVQVNNINLIGTQNNHSDTGKAVSHISNFWQITSLLQMLIKVKII